MTKASSRKSPKPRGLFLAGHPALDFLNTRQHTLDGRKVAFQHCDVKPSNMLLIDGSVKLTDFGLSVMTGSV